MTRRLCLLVAAAVAACGPDTAPATDGTADVGSAQFDPGAVTVGDSVGGLEIVAMDVRRVFDDSVWAGRVEFRGRLTVAGVYQRHFDYPEPAALCFHVLGDGATPVEATVVVDRYRLIREFSDVFDGVTRICS